MTFMYNGVDEAREPSQAHLPLHLELQAQPDVHAHVHRFWIVSADEQINQRFGTILDHNFQLKVSEFK